MIAPTIALEAVAPVADLSVGDGSPVPNACEFAGTFDINETFPAGRETRPLHPFM